MNQNFDDMKFDINDIVQKPYPKPFETAAPVYTKAKSKYLEPNYKYAEDSIITDFHTFVDGSYAGHYQTEEEEIQAFDAWIALGDATPTFRNTALKYLWRYGKKDGLNKKDLFKVMHYTLMMLYNDHYKVEPQKDV